MWDQQRLQLIDDGVGSTYYGQMAMVTEIQTQQTLNVLWRLDGPMFWVL